MKTAMNNVVNAFDRERHGDKSAKAVEWRIYTTLYGAGHATISLSDVGDQPYDYVAEHMQLA